MTTSDRIVRAATVLVALVLLGISLPRSQTQTTYGSIVGNVRDSSGAAMPNVAVTVTNEANGEQFKQLTNPVGAYAFTTLFPGVYKIHAQMTGFESIDIQNIH